MILLDTHVLVWSAEGHERLGVAAGARIEEARRTEHVGISAITPWEIALLVKKGRLRLSWEVGAWMERIFGEAGIDLLPIEPAIALDSVRLPGDFHADPADRFIVATARYRRALLLTADRAILGYAAAGHVTALDASR